MRHRLSQNGWQVPLLRVVFQCRQAGELSMSSLRVRAGSQHTSHADAAGHCVLNRAQWPLCRHSLISEAVYRWHRNLQQKCKRGNCNWIRVVARKHHGHVNGRLDLLLCGGLPQAIVGRTVSLWSCQ